MITAAPINVRNSGATVHTNQSMPITQASPEYSRGATVAAGACLNANVTPHCPMAPVTATPSRIGQCVGFSATQSGNAMAVAPIASMPVIQNIIDCVLSVRPSRRTSTVDSAYDTAVPKMASVPAQV